MNCPWCNKAMQFRQIAIKDTDLSNHIKIANFDKSVLAYVCFNDDCNEYIRINQKN